MKWLLLLTMLSVRVASAATINAASGSVTDINTANASAVAGDIVIIPPSTNTWTTALNQIPAGIIIQGTPGQTVITNNVNDYAMHFVLAANKTNEMRWFTFAGGSSIYQCAYVEGSNIDMRRFIAISNTWNYGPQGFKFDTVRGVVRKTFMISNPPGNRLAHLKDSTYAGLLSGNGAWTNATPKFGTEDFMFFEDNVVTTTNTQFTMSIIDSQAGARYVWRYNFMTNAYIEGHGSEAAYERSTHAIEAYGNVFDGKNVNSIFTFYRGGVGLVFSNSISGVNGVAACLKLENNRMNDALFTPFGGSDGRNHWDVNSGSNPFVTGTCSSSGTQTMTDSGKSWTPSQWIGYTLRKTSGKAVTSINRSGTTLTVVCTGHGFSSNDKVSIFGADQQEYNTLYTITVSNANTFTCTTTGAQPTTPATGTIKACLGNNYAEITANTATQLTFNPSIYGAPITMAFAAADTYEINLVLQGMDQPGRTGGSLIDSTATPSFPAGWNDQTTSAWYQWENNSGSQSGIAFGPVSRTIVVGTNCINDTPKPGYTPYPYPWGGTNQSSGASAAYYPPSPRNRFGF